MGAWGEGPFDNDDGADWLYELERASGVDVVRSALRTAAESAGYLEAPEASVAVAAAETVAVALAGRQRSTPDGLARWVTTWRASFGDDDRVLALAAVDRVLADGSELAELWGEAVEWSSVMQDLRARLTGP